MIKSSVAQFDIPSDFQSLKLISMYASERGDSVYSGDGFHIGSRKLKLVCSPTTVWFRQICTIYVPDQTEKFNVKSRMSIAHIKLDKNTSKAEDCLALQSFF